MIPLWVMSEDIPIMDDFGDRELDSLVRDYRVALNDTRPYFYNMYLFETTSPLDKQIISDLKSYFIISIGSENKVEIDKVNEILEQAIPSGSDY